VTSRRPSDGGVIGPNSVIQLGLALRDLLGRDEARRVFETAGCADLFDTPPVGMIDQAIPARLMETACRLLPEAEARRVFSEAGRRTADYVIANRIPRFAQWIMKVLPRKLGARLLLGAIERNAWTFCGTGQCTTQSRAGFILKLSNNPIPTPDCVWHAAVLQRLFAQLISARAQVDWSSFRSGPDRIDRFEFVL